jgi:hypothetical protein
MRLRPSVVRKSPWSGKVLKWKCRWSVLPLIGLSAEKMLKISGFPLLCTVLSAIYCMILLITASQLGKMYVTTKHAQFSAW